MLTCNCESCCEAISKGKVKKQNIWPKKKIFLTKLFFLTHCCFGRDREKCKGSECDALCSLMKREIIKILRDSLPWACKSQISQYLLDYQSVPYCREQQHAGQHYHSQLIHENTIHNIIGIFKNNIESTCFSYSGPQDPASSSVVILVILVLLTNILKVSTNLSITMKTLSLMTGPHSRPAA